MIVAYFFSFFYAISAVIGGVMLFGANVRAVHAMFFVLLFTGLWILVFLGYSSIFYIAIGVIINLLIAGVFMLGGVYKGVHLDVSDRVAGWIFVAIVSVFLLVLLVLIGVSGEIFFEIPNFLSYLVFLIFICVFGSIYVIEKCGKTSVENVN